jgi:hypothetical protein
MFHHITHDDPDATIEVHPSQELVRLIWKDHVQGDRYRKILLLLMDAVQKYSIRLWLNDGRKGGSIPPEDQLWTMQEFTPQVMAAGLRRIALVNSEDRSHNSTVDRMVNETPAEATYDVAFFEDPSIAQLWLMDPSKTNVIAAWTPGRDKTQG